MSAARPRRPGLFALLALAVLGLSTASGLVDVLATAQGRAAGAWTLRLEDGTAARRRLFGAYAEGIDAIRRRIPPSGTYLLVEVRKDQGAAGVVAYDLAPRRAVVAEKGAETAAGLKSKGPPAGAPDWVVVARGERQAPLLGTREEFFGR